MHAFNSLLVLGGFALQAVLGRPGPGPARARGESALLRRDVDSFIATEEPIALEQLLCNIGPTGCHSQGVAAGLVIASPSTDDPDYFYHWTRDASLVFKAIVERFIENYDAGLQTNIQDFITSQARLQTVSNPSGGLSDGRGFGEAKYNVDFTPFNGNWGRPQGDGPALRAIAMITYSNWLLANGYTATVRDVVWPIIRNDLAYTAQYWNQTSFDLWEEINGSSFFTVAAQHRALVQGSNLARALGTTCPHCDAIAPPVLCFLQTFWAPDRGVTLANTNVNNGRRNLDANVILGSIHNFDAALACDAATFQPCSDRALASHKVVVDSFRAAYTINSGIPAGTAVAVGRYTEDVYYNGNPWYLNTLAAAEQLYDALYVWNRQGSITVTATSLAFFRDLVPSVSAGTYAAGSATYATLSSAVRAYADGFVDVVAAYTPADGALSEQYDRNNGRPLSARDLTWSYAAFLTAVARRAAVPAAPWAGANPAATSVPATCVATSIVGTYSTATATAFPTGQTPISSRPGTTTTRATTTTTRTTPAPTTTCTPAASVRVTFNALRQTVPGQTVKMVGNVAALANWGASEAVPLTAYGYTAANPLWSVTITLPAGLAIEYKYIVVESDGRVTWEADPNRAWTVPRSCAATATKTDTWQS